MLKAENKIKILWNKIYIYIFPETSFLAPYHLCWSTAVSEGSRTCMSRRRVDQARTFSDVLPHLLHVLAYCGVADHLDLCSATAQLLVPDVLGG